MGSLAFAVGGGKVRVGSSGVGGKGMYRAEPPREQDGGDTFLDTTDSSLRQQYRTAFCTLKYTRSSYKPAIYVDDGLPFDAPSEVFGGGDLAVAVGGGKARVGSSGVEGEGLYQEESQRARNGGDTFLDTTDSSIRRQYRTPGSFLRVEIYAQ